ncbi:MAG: DNA oxidative demethylase AlkB [Gammaproteobacteria bacterium]|nr:DNA oxidative demethylase AlkB [Gammaproteobacteria bacterium]
MTLPLFPSTPTPVPLSADAALLCGFALPVADALLEALHGVAAAAPFRHMLTPGNRRMSAAMTNCGALGWVSDRRGYRYVATDPDSGLAWPAMPATFLELARAAAAAAGFDDFQPDACLMNRYKGDARLSLHQDRDELPLDQPIVSVSLGLTADFLWGGAVRNARVRRVPVNHGDVVVWGGDDRLRFHGVEAPGAGQHPAAGAVRYNLSFRRAR